MEEVFLQTGVLMRGLAHPNLFPAATANDSNARQPASVAAAAAYAVGAAELEEAGSSSGVGGGGGSGAGGGGGGGGGGGEDNELLRSVSNLYSTYGAVEVSPRNYFR